MQKILLVITGAQLSKEQTTVLEKKINEALQEIDPKATGILFPYTENQSVIATGGSTIEGVIQIG